MELPGAIGGEDHQGRRLRGDGPDLRDGDLEVGQELEQEGLELVIGPVDLVDQEHRPISGLYRRQQGPLQEELGAEQLVDLALIAEAMLGERPDLEHLSGVVPLVQGLIGVDALVALETDQPAVEDRRQNLGDFGLPHAHLTLEKERPAQGHGDEDGGGKAAIGEVSALAEKIGELFDARRWLGSRVAAQRGTACSLG